MKTVLRKILLSVLAITICMSIGNYSVVVEAAVPENYLGRVIDGSILTNAPESEDTKQILTRGNILNKGTAKCVNSGDGKVTAAGITLAHQVCDNIRMVISLDQFDEQSDSWYSFETWNVSKQNASMYMESFKVDVELGHFYRVRGYHSAEKGDLIESVDTCTDGIWIE